MSDKNIEHWSGYWEQGLITSLPMDFKQNYDSEVKDFWFSQFAELPEYSSVLDICTGNGAIAILAAEYSRDNKKSFNITAMDAARLNVRTLVQKNPNLASIIESISFVDETGLEDFDAEKESFDLITSQYGVEYCDWDKVNLTLASLLKPSGKLVFVTHALDTRILEITKNDYELLNKMNFFPRVKKLIRNDASQKELQSYFVDVGNELSRSLLTKVSPTLKPLMEACRFIMEANAEQFSERKASLFLFLKSLFWGKGRFEDLLNVHHKLSENPDWYQAFEVDGVSIEKKSSISFQGKPAGDSYIFVKSV